MSADEERDGVPLTHLDQPLSDDGATKRDLVDYLDAVHERLLPGLAGRPLSVVRVRPGQPGFMQKNVPKYAPSWIPTVKLWAQASKREVSYALCNDRRTLLWFANQRAVEYHPTLVLAERWDVPTHLIMDIDPPEGEPFAVAAAAAHLVRRALENDGLAGAVKTSGSKGVHIFVPLEPHSHEDVAAATRALAARAERLDPALATTAYIKDDRDGKVFLDSTRAGGATVVAAYSPRLRPGLPVSFPVGWDRLDSVSPLDFTVHTAPSLLGGDDPWAAAMPAPQRLPSDLVDEGHTIPVARVAAMREGKRRARERQQ
ncbi:DNA polymerase domain-containing protein [Jiangella sp. DSM 45060]|uniref:DNA polymerase domain-containing protein n=1 Tax=Jiangella sp. DSM 45060 TaxID=1798224 RepID=UPI00087BC4EA|nr:ATP-dependent DNA ligase [Jiangella sp. DSM 45060]SDT34209.1 DNA ligase D, polymerase domain-containing protein [Jiangella sp. DSM 45060]